MQLGNFSHSVVVKEWPFRHCFVSLPRPWASLILPAPTPTFSLEVSEEQSVLLSWAGDVHTPSPGDENTVLVGREILRNCGISDGEFGMVMQVQVPPPCTSVAVRVGSLSEWQDLALNADVAQSVFLSQVRVVSLGQSLPLWLEGGVLVSLTVTRIDPPHSCGILQSMTEVEVLPPTEQEESETFCPISFTPAGTEAFEEEKLSDKPLGKATIPSGVSDDNLDRADKSDSNNLRHSFELLMKYVTHRLEQHRVTSEFALRKEFALGYRVLPMPEPGENCYISDILVKHPSLVIVSRQSLVSVECQNEVSFIARIKKVDSPKERAEKLAASREEDKAREAKNQVSSAEVSEVPKLGEKLCTIIVWENYIKKKGEHSKFITSVGSLVRGNSCVVSDCLRRLIKLDILSVIELNNLDINMKTSPVAIDMSPLMQIDGVNIGVVSDTLKQMLGDFANETCVVINAVTLLNIKVKGEVMDVIVTVRDGTPLKLNRESVVLLDVTHVSDPLNIPHIASSVDDLDVKILAKFPYLGNEKVISDLQQHILLGSGYLVQHYKGVPQFALLHGSKGSGKTSLLQTLAQNLSASPYFLHFQFVNFKQLKGKKMETVEKKLQSVFREAIFRRPSIIVLEDLDCIVPSKGLEDQDSEPMHDHTMQMINMLKVLLDELLEFCHSDDDSFFHGSGARGSVMLIASALLRTSVHPLLVNPQGCHYFPCSFGIPPLEPSERVTALNAMIENYFRIDAFHHGSASHACMVEHPQNEENVSEEQRKYVSIDANLTRKLTENYVLPDLNHLALRTFLQAQHRWKTKAKQSKCCSKCGKTVVKKSQSTSDSLLSLAITEPGSGRESECSIINADLEAAHRGYIPLALRGKTFQLELWGSDSQNI